MSLIENIRSLHSDIDRNVYKIVLELQNKEDLQKRIVQQNHRINNNLLDIQKKSRDLLQLYSDPQHLIRNEINNLKGTNLQDTVKNFDGKFANLIKFHQNKDEKEIINEELLDQKKMKMNFFLQHKNEKEVPFSTEERYGRFLDLHSSYNTYINLFPSTKGSQNVTLTYAAYLNIFYLFHHIEKHKKKSQKYRQYLENLYNYLLGFHKRTQPLSNISNIMLQTTKYFQENFKKGKIPGWPNKILNEDKSKNRIIEKIEIVPSNESKNIANKKLKRKKRKRKRKKIGIEYFRSIAFLEVKITRFVNLLSEHLDATKDQVEKKRIRTYEEYQSEIQREHDKENELLEAQNKSLKEEEEYSSIGTNPLNLPLGWDGKPIPFWLYKLHGLGKEYKCEICGNYSYWGHRAFERHFREWRHAHGMKCLNIPNSSHFHHITKIGDAFRLWNRIKERYEGTVWNEDEEEFEDEDGNIYSKKTYEDLKKQGLL